MTHAYCALASAFALAIGCLCGWHTRSNHDKIRDAEMRLLSLREKELRQRLSGLARACRRINLGGNVEQLYDTATVAKALGIKTLLCLMEPVEEPRGEF